MDDKSLYAAILGLKEPWGVEKVELRLGDGEVHIWVALPKDTLWVCPECLAAAPIHDHREREWRHLDTCQYRTLVHARIPCLSCPTHGVRQVRVPWAEEQARFTALFEALAIDWMKHTAIAPVAERLRLSWDEAAGIQARAVTRGCAVGLLGSWGGQRPSREIMSGGRAVTRGATAAGGVNVAFALRQALDAQFSPRAVALTPRVLDRLWKLAPLEGASSARVDLGPVQAAPEAAGRRLVGQPRSPSTSNCRTKSNCPTHDRSSLPSPHGS